MNTKNTFSCLNNTAEYLVSYIKESYNINNRRTLDLIFKKLRIIYIISYILKRGKKFSFCIKLKFCLATYISYILKYLRSTTFNCKFIGIRKYEFAAKTYLLLALLIC